MKILVYIVIAAFLMFPAGIYGQKDSLVLDEEAWDDGFEKNLDSIMQLWYVKNAVTPDSLSASEEIVKDTIIPEFPA